MSVTENEMLFVDTRKIAIEALNRALARSEDGVEIDPLALAHTAALVGLMDAVRDVAWELDTDQPESFATRLLDAVMCVADGAH